MTHRVLRQADPRKSELRERSLGRQSNAIGEGVPARFDGRTPGELRASSGPRLVAERWRSWLGLRVKGKGTASLLPRTASVTKNATPCRRQTVERYDTAPPLADGPDQPEATPMIGIQDIALD